VFLGHFGLAFAAKKVAPRASLGTTVLAAQWSDVLWPIFLLLGWERVRIEPGNTAFTPLAFDHYPWTHSLLMTVVWALAFALAYHAVTRYRGGAIIIALCVVSHWVLDFVTHRPDLPLYPGGARRLGLGMWNNIPVTIATESVMFLFAVWTYLRITRPLDRIGQWGTWALIAFFVLIHVGNATSAPPPSTRAIALVGLSAWLIPLWAWWADRHRAPDDRVR